MPLPQGVSGVHHGELAVAVAGLANRGPRGLRTHPLGRKTLRIAAVPYSAILHTLYHTEEGMKYTLYTNYTSIWVFCNGQY